MNNAIFAVWTKLGFSSYLRLGLFFSVRHMTGLSNRKGAKLSEISLAIDNSVTYEQNPVPDIGHDEWRNNHCA